jgi:hypothetical protein
VSVSLPVGTPYIGPMGAKNEEVNARIDCRVVSSDFVDFCAASDGSSRAVILCGICGLKGFTQKDLWNVIISECQEGRYCYFHASCLGHYFLDAYFTDLHVPVLPTGNDFTCRERFDDLVAKRCPSCTLSMKRAMF